MIENIVNTENRTIAAIATPSGSGGIGVIRMSGPRAFEIAARHFARGRDGHVDEKRFAGQQANMLTYGSYVSREGETVDEVMAVKMKAPHSFTCEDVVEYQCHGGIVVMREILADLLDDGAEPAEPGEFTKRAFFNGRIDLSQAEAVMEIIDAKSKSSSRAAMGALKGRLSAKIKEIREILVGLMAQLEVNADYPEYDVEVLTAEKLRAGLEQSRSLMKKLLKTYDRGRMVRNGITLAITGKPNVGKSSLLNFLAGHERAIVSDIPGTTRDSIEEYVEIGGIPAKIVDTAGIRQSDDVIEQMGVDRAREIAAEADIVLLMTEAGEWQETAMSTDANTVADSDAAADRERDDEPCGGTRIVVINKSDCISEDEAARVKEQAAEKFPGKRVVLTSMLTEEGTEELYEALCEVMKQGDGDSANEVLLTNSRHKALIEKAAEGMTASIEAIEAGMPNDCVAIDIIDAMNALGEITGESVRDDIAKEIFAKFCIGK